MRAETHHLLDSLGFAKLGTDPEARDHELYATVTGVPTISVPSAGCKPSDVVRIIFHTGAAAARKEIATKHQAFLTALTR